MVAKMATEYPHRKEVEDGQVSLTVKTERVMVEAAMEVEAAMAMAAVRVEDECRGH